MFLNRKKFLFFIATALFLAVFILPETAWALDVGANQAAQIGLGQANPKVIIVKIIQVALGFLSLLAVMLILYAGFIWMTSGGNDQKVDQAKKILRNALIGLLIILASFGIVSFVLNKLQQATGGGGSGGSGGGGGGGIPASGSKIIESVYPAPGQRDVPRNTWIAVTFREPMNPTSIIQDTNNNGTIGDWVDINGDNVMDAGEYDDIDTNAIQIRKQADMPNGPTVDDVFASVSADHRTFVFRPMQYLGSPSEPVWYTVVLSTSIEKFNGDPAFGTTMGGVGYSWSFEVSTIIDTTPPKIISVIPQPGSTMARNVVIQINFNEAVNPLSAAGPVGDINNPSFDNIEVRNQSASPAVLVAGNFYLSNQYKTVEFLSDNLCGVNSCGDNVYCLPADSQIQTFVKAATLALPGSDSAQAAFPFNGVVDMAGNSLDGNADGLAQGPASDCELIDLSTRPYCLPSGSGPADGDNAFWEFSTNNQIDLSAPQIISIFPDFNENNIDLEADPQAVFNKILMSASINKSSVILDTNSAVIDYWLGKTNDTDLSQTTVNIHHRPFAQDTSYRVHFNSRLKDIYQNCYSPCAGSGAAGCSADETNPSCCNGTPQAGASCN